MISAKEAKQAVLNFYKHDEKIQYYQVLVDKAIKNAANTGQSWCYITMEEMVADIILDILAEKEFDLKIAKTNGVCYTWISW